MLFGEARSCSDEEKRAIASTVVNRVRNRGWYGNTVREVVFKPAQYSCFNRADPNFVKLHDPQRYDADSFARCLTVADEVLVSGYQACTEATHYHLKGKTPS